ncbi:hypothetical protein CTI12_AA356960 [Artemisia annua]|uniref:Uncharacterized protein n=1 Tax=Artemisia annua TaxID=35608 RepID=A0A2U1MPH3_ARTAN|nr:hypothetical protein CTI12_AA356960 [Artemisia annua]
MEEGKVLKNGIELVKSVSDKHLDLLRPSSRLFSIFKGHNNREKGKYALIKDSDDFQQGLYDKPMPYFGCGIGWFSFLIGFAFPVMWYYATFLYFGNYYRKDPRERVGIAASAIVVSPLLFWQNVCGKIDGLGRVFTDVTVIVIVAGDGMFNYLVHCSNDPTILA